MLKKILSPLLLILFVVGGAVAGDFIKNGKSETGGHEEEASHGAKAKSSAKKKDSHGKEKSSKKDDHGKKKKSSKKKDSHGKSKASKKGGGHGDSAAYSDGPTYLKFKRQFVVPVMTNGKIEALVIMNLNYELDDDAPDNVYSFEPKLRDAIMRELLAMSNQGVFGEELTMAKNYEALRTALLRAGNRVLREGIRDVLILDIARQEQ